MGNCILSPETLAVSQSQILGEALSAARDIEPVFDIFQQQIKSESGSLKLVPPPDRNVVEYIRIVGGQARIYRCADQLPEYREQAVPSVNSHVVA